MDRLVTAALDAYIQERRRLLMDEDKSQAQDETGIPMDQLQGMVHRLLETCCADGKYDHALGIAVAERRYDRRACHVTLLRRRPEFLDSRGRQKWCTLGQTSTSV